MTVAIVRPEAEGSARQDTSPDRCRGTARQPQGDAPVAAPACGESTCTAIVRHRGGWYGVLTDDGRLFVTHCAWCKRVRTTAGRWDQLPPHVEMDDATTHTHGICPPCAVAWRAAYRVPAKSRS